MSGWPSMEALEQYLKETGSDAVVLRQDGDISVLTEETAVAVKKPSVVYEDWEREFAIAHSKPEYLWFRLRGMVQTVYEEMSGKAVVCKMAGGTEVVPNPHFPALHEPSRWTGPERAFFLYYLMPRLQSGTFEFVMDQVRIYMPGQKVTPDFVAVDGKGVAHHYEVKGEYKLRSESRASVKMRWLKSYLQAHGSPHRVYWAKKTGIGGFKVKEVKAEMGKHPATKRRRK